MRELVSGRHLETVVARIVSINDGLRTFWSSANGWAPTEAAHILSQARLDWQVSLSKCLSLWLKRDHLRTEAGVLILAWANLGSLVEGTMKLFLSVWYNDYKSDIDAIKRKGMTIDPEVLTLEPMRQLFKKKIWRKSELHWDEWIRDIQRRRNAIHSFKHRELGTVQDFYLALNKYLRFLECVNDRLPYPDDIYKPR